MADRPSMEKLFFEQAAKRRQRAIDTEAIKKLDGHRPKIGADEASHLVKYMNWQCTGVRATLAANKRVPFRGLSWKSIGQMWGVGYMTVRKLSQAKPLYNGKMYRPGCFPAEYQIEAQVRELTRLHTELQKVKRDRKISIGTLRNRANTAGSIGQQAKVSGELVPASWFYSLCSDRGIARPQTLAQLNDAVDTLVKSGEQDFEQMVLARGEIEKLILSS